MSHICIIELTSKSDLDLLSATLTTVKIDDRTGAIIGQPHFRGNGTLSIQPLIGLNQQVVEKFKTVTCEHKYLGGIQIPDNFISNVNFIDELRSDIQDLQHLLNRTFEQASWSVIREAILQSLYGIPLDELVRLVILTDDRRLQALSVENTSFITDRLVGEDRLRLVSVVFDPRRQPRNIIWNDVPKVLLILGSQEAIEQPICIEEINKYFPLPAIFTSLYHPTPEQVLDTISDRVFDVIIIVGHSCTNDDGLDGIININKEDKISIRQFVQPFRKSVNTGLKLVILAGCSSIGIARALSSNNIGVPNVIAFRVPVHYQVLRLFFQRLLFYWIDKSQSLEIALTNTRGDLIAHEGNCPGASILPILFTSPYDPPLNFPPKIRSPWQKTLHTLRSHSLVTIKFGGREVKIPSIAWIGLGAIAILWGYYQGVVGSAKLEPVCNAIQGDGISCGEEIFLLEANIRPQQDKQDGANAIASGDYSQAIHFLAKAWEAKKDPETLIMLENAKAANQSLPIKSIAITIPGSYSTPLDIPTGMLKAAAHAQQQWNADPSHQWKLRVVIADDKNNKSSAPGLATTLLKRGILAGIGSYSSEVTLSLKDTYKANNTVLISSTSTSSELTNSSANTFFFRTCSSNEVSGKKIASYLKNNKYAKIVLFHTPGRTFSDSMTAALKANIQGVKIVEEFDFAGRVPAKDEIDRAKKNGAQAIVLIPDAYTSAAPERLRLLSIIRENNGDLPIIGNEVIKDQTLFNFSKQQIQKLVISLPWHPLTYIDSSIVPPSFWGNKSQLDHRIAMTYDATQAIIAALDILPINLEINDARKQIQQKLSNSTFSIRGITGQISFIGSDRSQSIESLVKPKCDNTKCEGFEPAP